MRRVCNLKGHVLARLRLFEDYVEGQTTEITPDGQKNGLKTCILLFVTVVYYAVIILCLPCICYVLLCFSMLLLCFAMF